MKAFLLTRRLLGYPASKISVLTTYNGQKALLRDVFERRCANNPAFGRPHKVSARPDALLSFLAVALTLVPLFPQVGGRCELCSLVNVAEHARHSAHTVPAAAHAVAAWTCVSSVTNNNQGEDAHLGFMSSPPRRRWRRWTSIRGSRMSTCC